MGYDYSKLKGKIKEIFGTQSAFAVAIGLSDATVSDKLNGKTCWTQDEIIKACHLLHIAISDIPIYFFYLIS